VAYDRIAAQSGAATHPVIFAEFSEMFSAAEIAQKATEHHGVDLVAARALTKEGVLPTVENATAHSHLRFSPQPEEPRPWRVIIFEVSPEGIDLYWATEEPAAGGKPAAVGKRTLVGRLPARGLAAERQRVQQQLGRIIGDPSPVVPAWHPRRPIGVWANDSTVSIKRVTIDPLPSVAEVPAP
jgi:hypothetical protein